MSLEATSQHSGVSTPLSLELLPIVVLLGAAVVAVPLFKRLGLGSVTGYLAAGLVIGPYGFGVISDPQSVLHIAEFGVVMFLFVIGLEMQPSRLWSMRGEIFGLGLAQVGVCSAALTGLGVALGYPIAQSFVGGTGFVLTSTAIVMQMLEERQVRGLPRGRRTIAILLLEDLAIVPLLALVALLAPEVARVTTSDQLKSLAMGIVSLATLLVVGRYLLNPLFRILGQAHAREVMTAAALFVVLGAALAMQLGGLSMAMGAFLAGVLLSESAFRHQLEADIEPFRGVLLGLFFLGVGMALDLAVIAASWKMVVITVLAYMTLKMAAIYVVARMFRLSNREAIGRSVLMAQGGEFAFVLYASATSAGILDAATNAILTSAVIASMLLTPFLIMFYDIFMQRRTRSLKGVETADNLSPDVLLIGFGRFGQIVCQPLLADSHSITIIETSTQAIFDLEPFGFKVYYGDGARLDILIAAGAQDTKLIIIAIDDRIACRKIVEIVKSEFPQTPVLARAYDREHAIELIHAGVDWQIRETMESALNLGEKALELLGSDTVGRQQVMTEVRQRDIERLNIESKDGLFAARDLIRNNVTNNRRNS